MKKIKITYWTFTGLFAALMLIAAIPDLFSVPEAIVIFKRLGYPMYLLPFIGFMKILGIVPVLVPGFPRIKEWAYAGFAFDLIGALYSHIVVGDPFVTWTGVLLGLILMVCSYIFYHKKLSIS